MRRTIVGLVLAAAVAAAAGCGGGEPTKAADPPAKGKAGKVVTPDPA